MILITLCMCTLHQSIIKSPNALKCTTVSYYSFGIRKKNYERFNQMSKLSFIKSDNNYLIFNKKPQKNVYSYLENNKLDEYELFTILNECCKSIMLYHTLLNCYHSNTTVQNFDIFDDNTCQISTVETDDKILSKRYNVIDYVTFFDSFVLSLHFKNTHFIMFARKFQHYFMKKMFN